MKLATNYTNDELMMNSNIIRDNLFLHFLVQHTILFIPVAELSKQVEDAENEPDKDYLDIIIGNKI